MTNDLYQFQNKLRLEPWFEFFDSDLEGFKSKLHQKILEFNLARLDRIFYVIGNSEYNQIPREWIEEEARFDEEVETLNQKAEAVVEVYDSLVRLARKKLGIKI